MTTNILYFLLLTPVLAVFKLQVLHVNDLHSRFEEISDGGGECKTGDKCYGGFARLQTALKASRQEGVNTIVLNAGDNFQGTPHYGVYKWRVVAAMLNKLKMDAMTLGNHEFDNGVKGLAPFIENSSIPITVCNLNLTTEPLLPSEKINKSIVVNINGTKIGIIGYITPDTMTLTVIKDHLISDEIPCIISEAKRLKSQNISIIIALGHSGIEMDKRIAAEVEDVDVIVGGHSHTFLYTGEPPDSDIPLDTYPVVVTQASGKRIPIVHAYAYSKYLGNISLTFDDDGNLQYFEGNPILLDNSVPEDEEMLVHLRQWSKNLDHFKKTVVGKSWVTLDGDCKGRECNFGNLATDALIYVFAGKKGRRGRVVIEQCKGPARVGDRVRMAGLHHLAKLYCVMMALGISENGTNYFAKEAVEMFSFREWQILSDKHDLPFDEGIAKVESWKGQLFAVVEPVVVAVNKNAKYNENNVSQYTEPSIALLQSGGIRATLVYHRGKENITMSDLMTAFPFENTVQRTRISGQILWEMLELSASAISRGNNKPFLQVSGLHVTYDLTAAPLKRVVKVFVRCSNCSVPSYSPLDKNKVYSILTSSFILYGGDGYLMLRGNHTTPVDIGNGTICDVLREYIEDVHVVYPEVSGRIRFLQDLEYSNGIRSTVISPLLVLVILFILYYTNTCM